MMAMRGAGRDTHVMPRLEHVLASFERLAEVQESAMGLPSTAVTPLRAATTTAASSSSVFILVSQLASAVVRFFLRALFGD